MHEYEEWLKTRERFGNNSLDSIKELLVRLGGVQNCLDIIHVAGTNGKGSVCRYIANVCKENNLKCGLYTSPYIDSINETIQIDGEYITDREIEEYLKKFIPIIEEMDREGYFITSFEIYTALMYYHFFKKAVQVAVIEVGLGGLNDATNVMMHPYASVITSISLDHTDILGDTLEKIAYQKAGIIKDAPVYYYPQKEEVEKVILEVAKEKGIEANTFSFDEIKETEDGFEFRGYKIKPSLLGKHQMYNAALALMVVDKLRTHWKRFETEKVEKAMNETTNPARIELLSKNPMLVLDGSHNKEGVDCLVETLKDFKYNRLILGYSVLKDKDIDYMLSKLMPIADEIVLTEIDNPRTSKLSDLKEKVSKYKEPFCLEDREEAFKKTLELAKEDDLILWCGSLYLMKDIRKIAQKYI